MVWVTCSRRGFIIAAAMLASLPAAAAEVPPQYRGLWCVIPVGDGDLYRRCRQPTSENILDIHRGRIGIYMDQGYCDIRDVTPVGNGHRITLRCGADPEGLAGIKLQIDARGRLRADVGAD